MPPKKFKEAKEKKMIKKKMKNFRLSQRTVEKLENLQKTLGITLTEVVARAIEMLHDAHKDG